MRSRTGWVGVKVDMQKAYDQFEWFAIMEIMKAAGFHHHFVRLIYQCMSTASLVILLNGVLLPQIRPTRGLRQGDPISPYLFILKTELFSRILIQEERQNRIKGLKAGRCSPPISHLLFADDLL